MEGVATFQVGIQLRDRSAPASLSATEVAEVLADAFDSQHVEWVAVFSADEPMFAIRKSED